MKANRAIDDDARANIVDRYQRGQSIQFIAYATSRDPRTVRRVLVEASVPIPRRRARNRNWGWKGGFAP